MTTILHNYPLKSLHTFHVDVYAREYVRFEDEMGMLDFLRSMDLKHKAYLILGGGSNFLFTKNYEGIVFHPVLKGIVVEKEDTDHVYVRVYAGEVWDDFVEYAVNHHLGGIENLSLIPGNTGASPIQNIGAYGVEVKDVIESVNAIDLTTKKQATFSWDQCGFSYRYSHFKGKYKGKYMVTSVLFKLKKRPVFQLDYGSVREEVEKLGEMTLSNIRQAIVSIRNSKLPDPEKTGNAGSFFKNPWVTEKVLQELLSRHPALPYYRGNGGEIKVPAGWLIEQCGWKGKNMGNAGVHSKQALVLINLGKASGEEILSLSRKIQDSVFAKVGITLEPEVNIL